ncbi:MAG: peptide chain release factor N(5)-glutamine methyltransferase [Deltaproteobacteria bacterium]|nr:MAG: peptide chain release factor N(5)-glutamine methyltransferase [Deltaproteobacteria bacterium]
MANSTWTVLELLRWTQAHFTSKGIETARLDAECLLAHVRGTDRLRLYVDFDRPVDEAERARFRELVRRRATDRVPVAQLTGVREFWSLPLAINRDVLVPRPETETLVQVALELAPDPDAELRVLDVGTGSGAVALALARERPKARITATDLSPAALELARRNAEALSLCERIHFACGDLYEPVRGERFDLVVSNPPYVARGAALPPELAHEPELALFAGADGLDVLRLLVQDLDAMLEPGGAAAFELAPDQAGSVERALAAGGFVDVRTTRDLARRPRVVSARRPNPEAG